MGFPLVIVLGGILSIFPTAVGVGVSVGVPFTVQGVNTLADYNVVRVTSCSSR